jgi:hypothetical protein
VARTWEDNEADEDLLSEPGFHMPPASDGDEDQCEGSDEESDKEEQVVETVGGRGGGTKHDDDAGSSLPSGHGPASSSCAAGAEDSEDCSDDVHLEMLCNIIASSVPVSNSPVLDPDPEGEGEDLVAAFEHVYMEVVDPEEPECFEIFTGLGRAQVTMVVCAATTVDELKAEITETFGVSAADMRMTFGGAEVEDGRTLGHYKLKQDSSFCTLVRVRGGAVIKQHLKKADVSKTLNVKTKKSLANLMQVDIDTMPAAPPAGSEFFAGPVASRMTELMSLKGLDEEEFIDATIKKLGDEDLASLAEMLKQRGVRPEERILMIANTLIPEMKQLHSYAFQKMVTDHQKVRRLMRRALSSATNDAQEGDGSRCSVM